MNYEFRKIIEMNTQHANSERSQPETKWLRYAILCLVGSFFVPYATGVSAVMLLYGIAKLVWQKRTRVAIVSTLIGPLCGCVYQALLWFHPQLISASAWMDTLAIQAAQSNTIFSLVAALMALLLGIEFSERITIGVISALSCAGAIIYAALEYVVFRGSAGLSADFTQSFKAVMSQMIPAHVEVTEAVQSVIDLFSQLWFVAYVQEIFFFIVLASIGVLIASQSSLRQPKVMDVRTLDMPLWVVTTFICGVAALIIAIFPVPYKHLFLLVGLTTVLCCRFPFMLQGFSVLFWTLRKKQIGCVGQSLLFIAAAMAESIFMPLSFVGLIDVWANIRKLPRSKS